MFYNSLSVDLQNQYQKSSQQFFEFHPTLSEALPMRQLNDFKLLITLSDFVLRSALQAPEIVFELFISGEIYQLSTPNYQEQLKQWLESCTTEEELYRLLRRYRLQQMVKVAFADLVLDISLDESLKRLSILADQLILSALNWLTIHYQDKWGVPLNAQGDVQPLLVYGMGKLGGKELNFSSDIDLIFVYPEAGSTHGSRRSIDNQQFFTRLGQKLITALHLNTADGFVYRVDMRLRPFGESGPLVLTFNAMEDYYQEQGRDWERYAMLKARLIGAGKYHHKLNTLLKPFVFRRYIDFSVIESLRRMKLMIAQEVRRKQLINNIKLGAGGIREVEFIVQVFQLIRGGRVEELQQRNLLAVLPLLVKKNELTKESADVLTQSYRLLRRVENIIQAINDQQTQTLPDNVLDQQRLMQVLQKGDTQWSQFIEMIHQHMRNVHLQFENLIGLESPNNQEFDQHWQVLWDSQWPDEECVAWINKIEHRWSADKFWQLIINFRQQLAKKAIGPRGRQVVDKLMPLLLCHLHKENAEQYALERVLVVIERIITRTAYLELLFENEGALRHLINICAASSWLTEHIAKYPILLDELIDPQLLHNVPALNSYAKELQENMLRTPEDDLEIQMGMLRQFKQIQQLRIAAADISDVLAITKVSDHLTALAEAIIGEVVNLAWKNISEKFGVPESLEGKSHKGFAVIAYGKVGGIELGYSSDLDLVFLHNSEASEVTVGAREIPASQFYMKLVQRIMHIFNAGMANGILYQLDMRLRPSGNSGLLVIKPDSFLQYQLEEAWTWEHQALVRARLVYGNAEITQQFNDIRKQILSIKRDKKELLNDVTTMRNKMRAHLDKSTEVVIDIKQGVGGLVDIEFLAQFLVLNYSNAYPAITEFSDNLRIFEQLQAVNIIDNEQQRRLSQSYCQLRHLAHRSTLKNEAQQVSAQEFYLYATQVIAIFNELMS